MKEAVKHQTEVAVIGQRVLLEVEQLVGEQLVADMIQRELLEVKAEYPMEVNYRKILLCEGSIA